MGAYVSCIILTFIIAFHHLHVSLVCQQVLLCALIWLFSSMSHHTDQGKTNVLLHRYSTAWGRLVTS